jgi:hypothetical protein
MSHEARRRCWIVTLCLAFAIAVSAQTMAGAAFAGSAARGLGMTSSMPDGCPECDCAKAGGGCAMTPCASLIGVLADVSALDRRAAALPAPTGEIGIAGCTTDPEPLPPRR